MAERFTLSAFERQHLPAAVLRGLLDHHGRERPITGMALAALLGHRDDRKIRLAIRDLIKEGYPVASSVTEPMGFYLCTTEQDARSYIATLRRRAEEDLSRLKDFEEAVAARWSIPQQPSLFGGN